MISSTSLVNADTLEYILGRAEYSNEPNMYLMSWPSDNGSTAEIWFKENELTPVASMPEPSA